jgi:hypothetical protein
LQPGLGREKEAAGRLCAEVDLGVRGYFEGTYSEALGSGTVVFGCSKLYRQRSWHNDYELLNFNSFHAKKTGVYFAGEAYSVEGGWIEPAVRSAIDAVAFLAHDVLGQDQRATEYSSVVPALHRRAGDTKQWIASTPRKGSQLSTIRHA